MTGYSQAFKEHVIKAILIDKMPIKEACRVFRISRDTVRTWVRREQGLIPKATKQPTSSEIKKEAVDKVLSGIPVKQVAMEYGKSLGTVYLWLKEAERQRLTAELEEFRSRFEMEKKAQ